MHEQKVTKLGSQKLHFLKSDQMCMSFSLFFFLNFYFVSKRKKCFYRKKSD